MIYPNNFPAFFLLFCAFAVEDGQGIGLVYKTPCCRRKTNEVPDLYKKTPDFIEANGFIAETHLVATEDGYIVTLHRIPGRRSEFAFNEIKHSYRPAVLIQHGIAGRSDNWILNGRKSFPYMLADAGYDVWLADSRGNYYSKKHIRLTPHDPKFWDFSFHEQGYYDLAAMTNYIINTTGQKKIFYVGHSRGTTMAYVLLSTRPEFNDKFHLIVTFSPVAYLKYAKSPLIKTVFKSTSSMEIRSLARHLRMLTLPGLSDRMVPLRRNFCNNGAPTQPLCSQLLFLLAGFDYELFNNTRVPVYATHFPDGGSLKEYLHYIQIARTDKFRPYDYGPDNNVKIYGQREPPEYNLENITAPSCMFYGVNDFVVSSEDLLHLDSRLKSTIARYEVPFKKFNHMDFLWATKADTLVYKPALRLMNSIWQRS